MYPDTVSRFAWFDGDTACRSTVRLDLRKALKRFLEYGRWGVGMGRYREQEKEKHEPRNYHRQNIFPTFNFRFSFRIYHKI